MRQNLTTNPPRSTYFVKIATLFLLVFGSLGIVGGSFLLKTKLNHLKQPEMITDTRSYKDIRQHRWFNQTHIQHFPVDIPSDASSTRIAYSPGSLHSNRFFQLRMKQPPEKITKLLTQYKSVAKHHYVGGNTNDHVNQTNGVPTTFFYTSDLQVDSFPSTYEILVLNASAQGSVDFKWKHGISYGVAIDKSGSEIIYWATEW